MKRTTRISALPLVALVLASGCSSQRKTAEPATAVHVEEKPSTARTVVDGLTGRTAVRAGTKARGQIESISARQQDNLDEIMGE